MIRNKKMTTTNGKYILLILCIMKLEKSNIRKFSGTFKKKPLIKKTIPCETDK